MMTRSTGQAIKCTWLRCVRDNLAGMRSKVVSLKYAANIENGQMAKKFVDFYIAKFSTNHTQRSSLSEGEKRRIVNTVRQLAVKDEKD